MSVSSKSAERLLSLSIAFGFLAGHTVAFPDDEALPDAEFLEYLGSWEESDEDWVLLAQVSDEQSDTERDDSGSERQQEKVVEVEDED